MCSNPVLIPTTCIMAGLFSLSHKSVKFLKAGEKMLFSLLDDQCPLGNGEQICFLINVLIVQWETEREIHQIPHQ